MKHERILFVMLAIAISFLLGWSMRGDSIYGSMFKSTVSGVEDLAISMSKGKTPK